MAQHILKGYHNVFVSAAGYVFKFINNEMHIFETRKNSIGDYVFNIGDKEYNLLYVMMETFKIRFTASDSIKFKATKKGYIPASSIIVKKFLRIDGLDDNETNHYYAYMCEQKANAANARGKGKITPVQVYYTLKLHDFKCKYCDKTLHPRKWHLDHHIPLSASGKNRFENIVPSCRRCNLMKGAFMPQEFIAHCKRVTLFNEAFKNNGHD